MRTSRDTIIYDLYDFSDATDTRKLCFDIANTHGKIQIKFTTSFVEGGSDEGDGWGTSPADEYAISDMNIRQSKPDGFLQNATGVVTMDWNCCCQKTDQYFHATADGETCQELQKTT